MSSLVAAGAFWVLALTTTATAFSAAPPDPPPGDPPTIQLFAINTPRLTGRFLAAVEGEVAAILATIGTTLKWTVVDPAATGHVPRRELQELAADVQAAIEVRFAASVPSQWGLRRETMGTAVAGALPRRRVVVFPQRILRVLGIRERTRLLSARNYNRRVARAFARIIVHEMAHALAPDLSHAETGLMRGTHDRRSLLADDLEFDPKTSARLVALLGRLAMSSPSGSRPVP